MSARNPPPLLETRRRSTTNAPIKYGKFISGTSPAVPPRKCSHLTNDSDSNGMTSPYLLRRAVSTSETPAGVNLEIGVENRKMLSCVGGKCAGGGRQTSQHAVSAASPSDAVRRPAHPNLSTASSIHNYPQKLGNNEHPRMQPQQLHKPGCWKSVSPTSNMTAANNTTAKSPDFVHAQAIAPFQDASYRNALLFTENEMVCVFVDSMEQATRDGGSSSGWWRGFRTAQGPGGPIGFFPSSHVTLLHPRATAQYLLPTRSSPELNKTAIVDLTTKTDKLSIQGNNSNSSNSDSVGEDGEEVFTDPSVSGGTPEEDRCPVSNGNEAVLHVEAGVLREIEALADTALQRGALQTCSLQSSSSSTTTTATHQEAQHITTSTAVRNSHCGPESMNSSNRNSATSLDSGRGSAYANSNDGSKNFAGTCNQFPGHHHHTPQQRTSLMMESSLPVFMGGEQRLPSPRHSACVSSETGPGFRSPIHVVPYPTGRLPPGPFRSLATTPWNPEGLHSCSSGSSASSCSSCGLSSNGGSFERKDNSMELLVSWLSSAGFSDYAACIVAAGYDLSTLSRATPEDLNACGVTNPRDRQQLRGRLGRLQLPESLPDHVPASTLEWLSILNLVMYWPSLQSQGLTTLEQIGALTWEDLEEIGITKLGHQKKMLLAIERLRRGLAKRNSEISEQYAVSMPKPPYTHARPFPLTTITTSTEPRIIASTDSSSLNRHRSFQSSSIENDDDTNELSEAESTPPPPPAFQDPPIIDGNLQRSTSLDKSTESAVTMKIASLKSSESSCVFEPLLGETAAPAGGPRPISLVQKPYEMPVRQRFRSSQTLTIPVAVANQMVPPPPGPGKMDRDLQDMHDIQSMLDKLSEHLVPTSHISSN